MYKSRFLDPKLEEQFEENGYAVIKGFLSPDEIAGLKKLYETYHNQFVDRLMWNSLYHTSRENSLYISKEILSVFNPKIASTFSDAKTVLATVMSKCPNQPDGFDTPHRDYSIFDENEFEYRQLWCPLIDINQENGAMYVIPRSHKLPHRILPVMNRCIYRDHKDEVMQYAQPLYLEAGDLLVYADKTLHGGYHNASGKERPVTHFAIFHPKAQLKYYRRANQNSNMVEEFNVPDMFFINNTIEDINNLPTFPEATLVRTFEWEPLTYDAKNLEQLEPVTA